MALQTPERRRRRGGRRLIRYGQVPGSFCWILLAVLAVVFIPEASHAQADEASAPATLATYSSLLDRLDSLNAYNRHIERLIDSQNRETSTMERELETIDDLRQNLPALMEKMVESLAAFIELDIPFDIEERRERVAKLRKDLGNSRLSQSDKYRRIVEAYQIENDYGRSVEAYRSTIESAGRERAADFLRVGRIALIYQTIDEAEAAAWNNEARSWQPLTSSTRSAIRRGLRVARKEAAPELLTLPLPTARASGAAGDAP